MIIPEGELEKHLGNSLDVLISACQEGRIRTATLRKIARYNRQTRAEFNLPAIDYLLLAQQLGNESMTKLATEASVAESTLKKIFILNNLPQLTHREYHLRLPVKNTSPNEEQAVWERKDYRGLSDLDYRMAFFISIISQHFLENQFKPKDVRAFLNKKRLDEGKENSGFYHSPTFSIWVSVRPPVTELFKIGVLERIVVERTYYSERSRKSYMYRFVPEAFRDLGAGNV